jgi:sugar-specific transcriptional regulator TrmB
MSGAKVRANALLQESLAPSLDRIGATLRDIGCSGNATSAFCALVRVPQATAGELVQTTGIPDSKIYYALGELVEKGLVEVQPGKPKVYRLVPASEVELRLSRMVQADFERRKAATVRVASLLEPLRVGMKAPVAEIAYIVKGMTNVVTRAKALIASTRKDLVLLTSDEALFRQLEDELLRLAHRRIRLRIAVPEMPIPRELAKVAEVRSIVCSCVLLVVDGQQVLTVSRTTEEDAYAITSTDPTLVRLGLDFWESPRCCLT